jgi:hypothetical protein
VPRNEWPRCVKAVATLARPQDKGIGDTVQRITAKFGGEAFKRAYRRIMAEDCGCTTRQTRMNNRYPYQQGN